LSRFRTVLFSYSSALRIRLLSGWRHQIDCHLAFGRVLLAAVCLVALSLDPGVVAPYRPVVLILAACYLAASLTFLLWAVASASTVADSLVSMHIVDLIYSPLICLFTGGFNTPAVVILLFAVLAAAYRWGFAETFLSAAASILLTALGRAIAETGGDAALHLSFPHPRSGASTFIAGAVCLLSLGVVLGYLAEREKSFRARILAVRQLITKDTPDAGLRETLERSLRTIASLTAARKVVLAVRDDRRGKAFVWGLDGGGTALPKVQFTPLSAAEHERYFFDAPEHSWHLSRRNLAGGSEGALPCLALDARGRRLPDEHFLFAGAFFLEQWVRSVFAINFEIPSEWSGRLFVMDSKLHTHASAELGFLQSLVWEALPTVYNVHVVQRLRSRVRAQERLRIAHEMHDGLLQSLISVEMQMDLLRRRPASPQGTAEELRRLQQLLHQGILGARSLMARLKLAEMSPRQMLDAMSDMVAAFRRETGIAASFVCESDPTGLPAHVCREIACMLQEALTNVRKHSGAKSVDVRFAMEAGCWKLVIADDGRGFEFSGRPSQIARDPRSAPLVLEERARSIGADVEIESRPGEGSRVEILLPPQEYADRSLVPS
jgi:signal transduction histidine kinase